VAGRTVTGPDDTVTVGVPGVKAAVAEVGRSSGPAAPIVAGSV
jgi:hypothetical protein